MDVPMKYRLSEINISQHGKIHVPNVIHFVWVGDTNRVNMEYIDIWKKTNKDKEVYFWHDEHASLCNLLHDAIREYVLLNDFDNNVHAEIWMKNKAFNYIFPKLKDRFYFNDLVVNFLLDNNIPYNCLTSSVLNPRLENEDFIVKNISELFSSELCDFMRYYYYEIILRTNLASASDIVRLLILYQYGGVYIDVDTRPYTDNVFDRLNQYLEKEKVREDDSLLLFKTKSILKKLSILDFSDGDYLNNFKNETDVERDKYHKILELIELDIAEFSLKKILPLGNMYVHKNLLAIGSLRRLKGIYFNNFISSHPGSKVVKIILRTMKKRYAFLEKNNCIFDYYKGGEEAKYLTRILTWRTELINREYCVTSVLSGPGLIVEVLLGIAYELLDFECVTEPSFIAEYMQNDKFGIALFQHNLDTPDGIYSSWRK